MVYRWIYADFQLALLCPVDKTSHSVRFQAYPLVPDHFLDVVACDAQARGERLTCGKNCRALIENGHYWQKIYPAVVRPMNSQ